MKLLPELEDNSINAIFADPPYFLSNGGISCQSGKVVCVDKGDWDKGGTPEYIYNFNKQWLSVCRDKLTDDGTIWISGTYHNIFAVANCLTELGYKILNVITWQKSDPPPNLSCRYFNFSTEYILWARKHEKKPHKFNYEVMKRLNGDKQMTDVWRIPAVGKWEKTCGKHPTQKPLRLLYRIILACTNEGDTILDPFAGSCTTGIAANLLGEIQKHAPEISKVWKGWENALGSASESGFVQRAYADSPRNSIDYALMEKSDNVWVLPVKFEWDDLGTWDSLYGFFSRHNPSGNAEMVAGPKIIRDASGNVIFSDTKNKLLVVRGLEDYMVIDTGDVLVVCPRDGKSLQDTLSEVSMPEFADFK